MITVGVLPERSIAESIATSRALGDVVHGGEHVVEHDDRRLVEEPASECGALSLAPREHDPSLADDRLKALLEGFHVGVERRLLDDLGHLPEIGLVVERDVLRDRLAEQERTLRHEPHLVAPRVEVEVHDVGAVDDDRAARRIEEPREQPQERGLAGARATEHAEDRAGADVRDRRAAARFCRGGRGRRR
jgi:hypothetical protein